MTWTTGTMSCFALAMLEWLQAGRGRRGAAGWMALERQPRWWPEDPGLALLATAGSAFSAKFPSLFSSVFSFVNGPSNGCCEGYCIRPAPRPGMVAARSRTSADEAAAVLNWVQRCQVPPWVMARGEKAAFHFPCRSQCAHPVASLPLHSGAVSATPPSLLPLPKAVSDLPDAWSPVPLGVASENCGASGTWQCCPYISWNSQPPAAEFSGVPRSGFPASQAQPRFPVSQGIYNETPSNADPIHSLFCSLCLHVAVLLNAASRHWGYNFHQADRVQTTCSTRLPSSVIPQQSTREGKSRDQDEVPAVCLSGAADALAPIEVIFSLFRATLWPQTPKRTFHFTCLSIKSFS